MNTNFYTEGNVGGAYDSSASMTQNLYTHLVLCEERFALSGVLPYYYLGDCEFTGLYFSDVPNLIKTVILTTICDSDRTYSGFHLFSICSRHKLKAQEK